ncbi:MAG: transcription termination/antitermination NusG family protein [Acidobacteriota bacterium]
MSESEETLAQDKKWYIIHTYSGFENRVKESLQNRIEAFGLQDYFGEIMIPTESVVEVKDGKKRVSTKKFFPGYVLVQMVMCDEASQIVRNTPKVTGFVDTFEIGEKVKIIDGPFASFQGVVESVNNDRQTLTVMVTIFGRSTPVELNYLQVEKL